MKKPDNTLRGQMRWYNADVYLPRKLAWLSVLLIPIGIAGIVLALSPACEESKVCFILIGGLGVLMVGAAVLLSVRYQMIVMLPDDRFAYQTMLGNTYVYHFNEINRIQLLPDSTHLVMQDRRHVHIEKMALRSTEFQERLSTVEEEIHQREIDRLRKMSQFEDR